MLKTVLFASVAVSALCLGPTFGWPTQLPNSLSHDMSIDTISTGKALGAGKSTALSMSQTSAVEQPGAKKRKVNNDDDNDSVVTSTSQPATSGTATTSQTSAVAQSGAKKRKVNDDDANDSEKAVAVVAQDAPESHPFKIILMVDDVNTLFSDVLDLKSYLALASTNKNGHVRKVITDKIMSKDLRGLHHIQWQRGPQVKTFLNYLFNRTVWKAQKEVLRAVHYRIDESESDAISDLARLVNRLDDPCLDGLQLKGQPPLQPSVRESVQPIKRIFNDLYGLMEDAFNTRRPFDFGLTVYKHMTPLTGKNLMDKNGGERQMALFLEHLIRLNQARLNNQLQVVPADFKESYYYDVPSSPEKRSVVERFENSVGLKRQLDELHNLPREDRHKKVARIFAQFFKDDIFFENAELEDFVDWLGSVSAEEFQSDYAETGSIFYEALDTYHHEFVKWWPKQTLLRAFKIMEALYESDPQIKYLVKNAELRELHLTELGDDATDKDICNTAMTYQDLWDAGIKQIHILERSAELFERELILMGDSATADDFGCLAGVYRKLGQADPAGIRQTHILERSAELYDRALTLKGDSAKARDFGSAASAYRQLWQSAPSQTHHFVRAITLFEQRYNLLQQKDAVDVFKRAWYALQHSRIELAQSLRREEAKSLWQQALQMGLLDEELDADDQVLFDTLNAEFGERTPEDL